MNIFKKFKKSKDVNKEEKEVKKEEKKEPTFAECLAENKAKILNEVNALDTESDTYKDDYAKLMALIKSVEDSEIKEEVLNGTKIENSNKAQETDLKKSEIKAGVAKTGITAGAAVLGCLSVPFIEQKVGPAMSKIASQASQALFKKN